MKITTLLENKTTCDALRCEHGLSLYIETEKHKILFDSGASDAFWENARALGIDLAQVDIAFLSHAHNDHCGGLLTFLRGNRTAKVYLQKEAFGDYYVVTPTKCAFIGLDPKLHEYATTAHLLCHLLQSAGIKTGRIGTDGIAWREKTQPNPYTTPPPTELHRILHQMVEDGITTVVMEVSSQALEQQRVEGITFAAAVFTNLSPEHLDYHGDMERYFASKAKIFSQCRCAVINTADPYGRRLLDRANVPISGYHLPWQYRCEPGRSILPWRGGQLIVPLTGEVFLPDALAAAETALVLGLTSRQVMAAMPQCPPVPGRAELLWQGMGRTILRDYAHTPDALERILRSLRRVHKGRLLVLFGCGGDRDRQKRPLMAKAAARWADGIIITDDNPRNEAPEAIRREIVVGLPKNTRWREVPDRRQAIEQTIAMMRQGDLLLLAGKGHEDYQIIQNKTTPFDEREIVTEILKSGRIPWKNCHCEK